MFKHFILAVAISLGFLSSFAQRIPNLKADQKRDEKIAKRDKMNELIRNEEEGIPAFKKQSTFQFKLNHDGNGAIYELGKMKTPYKASIFQIELGEKQHPKEQKQNSTSYGGGFTILGRPFVYGKQNIFYQLKVGAGQQLMIGGKSNKNGVAVYGIMVGGFSAGLTRPYYIEFAESASTVKKKFTEADRRYFLNASNIVGGTGLSLGWKEMKFNPGIYTKAGLRFDWARFNQVVSAIEFGFSFDYYSKKVVQMVDVPGKAFFPTGYVSVVFGNRK
jgi:hypothetical protein